MDVTVICYFTLFLMIVNGAHGRQLKQHEVISKAVKYMNEELVLPQSNLNTPTQCIASIQTNTPGKFLGANSTISVYKPQVQQSQWSAARVRLINDFDFIEAGWMVNPTLFKDNEAHLYTRISNGGQECINTQCQGFVQVSTAIPLGMIPEYYSIIGGQQYEWKVSIEKFILDGNWWITITSPNKKASIGYWPSDLFTNLKEAATQVQWGGEISNPGAINPVPAMGDGLKATFDNTTRSALIKDLIVVDASYQFLAPPDVQLFNSCDQIYTDLEFAKEFGPHVVAYGGPN